MKTLVYFLHIIFSLFLSILLSSCSTVAGPKDGANANVDALVVGGFPAVTREDISFKNYQEDVVKPGDVVNLTVSGVESLSKSYVTDGEGFLNLPLIGRVEALGESERGLQSILTKEYSLEYLQNPVIRVEIESRKFGDIILDGAVDKPGVYEISNVIRLTEALALGNGVLNDAETDSVAIVREIGGVRKLMTVNLSLIRVAEAHDPVIIPSDFIYVASKKDEFSVYEELLRAVPLLNTAVIIATR